MKQLSPQARRLFELIRDDDGPDEHGEARVRRALLARIALGASIQGIGGAVARAAAAGTKATVVFKSLVAAGMGGAMVVGTGWVALGPWHSSRAPHAILALDAGVRAGLRSPGRAAEPSAAGAASDREPAPAPMARPEEVRVATPRRPALRGGEIVDPLQVETDALRAAQQALRDGDSNRALRLLDEQDARFGAGLLREERAAARVLALSEEGRSEQACTEAKAFERRWPRSALLVRVRSACRSP